MVSVVFVVVVLFVQIGVDTHVQMHISSYGHYF